MDMVTILTELREERARIDEAVKAFERILRTRASRETVAEAVAVPDAVTGIGEYDADGFRHAD